MKTELPEAHPTKWTVISYGSVWARYATQLEAEATARALNAGKPGRRRLCSRRSLPGRARAEAKCVKGSAPPGPLGG